MFGRWLGALSVMKKHGTIVLKWSYIIKSRVGKALVHSRSAEKHILWHYRAFSNCQILVRAFCTCPTRPYTSFPKFGQCFLT